MAVTQVHEIPARRGQVVVVRPEDRPQPKARWVIDKRPIKRHYATFKPGHNDSKLRAMMVLWRDLRTANRGLTLREWAEEAKVSYKYLSAQAGKWVAWDYVSRRPVISDRGPVYRYRIDRVGKIILQYCIQDFPEFFEDNRLLIGR